MYKILSATLIAALMTLTSPLAPAMADDGKIVRMISVTGHGEVRAVPDIASISMGVMSTAETAQAALAANTATMKNLMALLKQAGIDDRDVATSNFSVNPRYDYGQNNTQPPKVVGYDVSNTVTITARKIDQLGDLLDKAVTAGSNQIYGISFSVSKPDAMLDEARKLALADARRKAEILAAAGNVSLGNVISISENAGFQPPMPVVMKSAARADMASPVPVAQGEQALSVDVIAVWELK